MQTRKLIRQDSSEASMNGRSYEEGALVHLDAIQIVEIMRRITRRLHELGHQYID